MATSTVDVKSWLWIEELSAEAGIPVRTLRHWRSTGTGGPPSFRIGRRIAYDRKEVAKWIGRQRAARA